ncbi:MAG TPA: BON domain-containing protein [Thermoanaerobaculia bacterium]
MPNRYRRGGSERDFDRGDETPNRGMFGYEGEGYMRGGAAGNDADEYAGRGYGRDTWADESTSRGGGGYGQSRGGDDYTTGFSGGYGTGDRYGTGGYGRGAYGGGGAMSGGGGDTGVGGWNRLREYGRGNRDDYEDTRGSYFTTGSVGADPRGYRDLEAGVGRDTNRPSHRGKGPKNYQRSDERIREDVCERLAMDHDVDASDIEVTVSAGTVTLTGMVPDRRAKRRAEDISESISGVKDVENQIRVNRDQG